MDIRYIQGVSYDYFVWVASYVVNCAEWVYSSISNLDSVQIEDIVLDNNYGDIHYTAKNRYYHLIVHASEISNYRERKLKRWIDKSDAPQYPILYATATTRKGCMVDCTSWMNKYSGPAGDFYKTLAPDISKVHLSKCIDFIDKEWKRGINVSQDDRIENIEYMDYKGNTQILMVG